MDLLTLPDIRQSPAVDPLARMVLRLRQAGNRVQMFPLVAGKCTIGSSSRCQIQLPASQSRPLQCLLALEADALVVTRWATGVLLNGREFSKSPLRQGDRLTIGSCEIELDGCDSLPKQEVAAAGESGDDIDKTFSAPAPATTAADGASAVASVSKSDGIEVLPAAEPPAAEKPIVDRRRIAQQTFADRVVLQLWMTGYGSRRRAKALLAGIRAARQQAAVLADRLANIEIQRDQALAAANAEEIDEITRALKATQAELTTTLESLAQQIATTDSLESELSLCRADRDRLAGDLAALAEAPPSLTHFERDLTTSEDALPPAGYESRQAEIPPAESDDPWKVAQADDAVNEPEEEPVAKAALAFHAEPCDEPSPPAAYAPTSFIDQYRHLLDEDAEPLAPASRNAARPVLDEEFLSPPKIETYANADSESDDALEAYMSSMMRRVRGDASPMAASQAPPADPISTAAAIDGASSSPVEADAVAPLDFETLRQSTRKQPLASDLSALREMANVSARSAIASHQQRRSQESAMGRIAIAATSMLTSAVIMASAPQFASWEFWVGSFVASVGLVAALQVLRIERRRSASRTELTPQGAIA